jgi:HEPN domain-containing protein
MEFHTGRKRVYRIMQNEQLAKDYVIRSEKRIVALKALFQVEAWADVVRESQEVVELALKGLLLHCHIAVPRVHDVSEVLAKEADALPQALISKIPEFSKISKSLRRDRELAFYGSEDLTPQNFYSKSDAELAMNQAIFIVTEVKPHVLE